ncbi:MAG: class I SAM-dependent methyltransferase [Chitinophagaceae bacterium]
MLSACIICHNVSGNQLIKLKELQLGLGEEFSYQLCGNCGSMQLLDPPADFTPFYPNEDYYSFTAGIKELKKPGYLRRAKAGYLLYGKNKVLGSLLSIGYKLPEFYEWMMGTKAQPNDAILDVGCGSGMLLGKLYKMGFTDLTGIDPFINEEHDFGEVKILKKEIEEMTGKFDTIMMHHALEHMADPLAAMKKAHALLNENKYLLVRIPIMGNYGWNVYREYWAGLDAPRHLFIPSEKGMRILAAEAGFEIDKLEYDTVDYLIWCSEQYKKGMSLYAKGSHMLDKKNSSFSKKQIREYKKILAEANAKNYGDTAAFYLRKK